MLPDETINCSCVLLQETGDPASDVLYESNYLLLNLQEAFAVTGER